MISPADLERWKAELDSGDPYRQDAAATDLADAFAADDTDWHVTVCDKFWNPIGYADDYLEVSGTIARNQAPQATLKLGQGHRLDSVLSACETTMVGVILETEGISEAFYVKRHRRKLENGAWTLTSELVGIWDILNYLPIWPSWYLPIQAQPFSHAVYAGPVCTVIEAAAAQQSFRIQAGINEFLNNALSLNPDVRAWFGTVLQSIQNSGQISTTMQTPLYVVRTGLLRDTSPLYVKTVRMTTVGQMIQEITPAYGVSVTVELWRPGMPQPDKWANLTQVTYVMRVVDRSQIEGPTKTVLDSALRTVVDVEGSLLGKTLDPLLNPGNQYVPEGMHIAPTLGIDFVPPYALLITPDDIIADGEVVRDESPLISCEIVHSTPLGWEHIIGGKSPKALNDLLNAWYSYIIDVAQILLGFTGVPSNVRAPLGNWGGTDIRAGWPVRRIPQRCVLRVRADTALQPPQRCRTVPPGHVGVHRYQQQPVQHRGAVPVHPSALEQPGLHDRDRHLPRPERTIQIRAGHLRRHADDPGVRVAHQALHRLRRTGQLPLDPIRP